MFYPKISACIICFNDENRIARCIKEVKPYVDEVIVLDSFSSDNTVDIAKKYTNKVYQLPFESYSSQNNKAASFANNEWICHIEVDEIFSKELWNELMKEAKKGSFKKYDAFCFPRKTFLIDTTKNYDKQLENLDKNKFSFTTKSYPNFAHRLHKKKLIFVGDAHSKLAVDKKRKFIPIDILHMNLTKSHRDIKNKIKKKELSKETKEYYSNKNKLIIRFLRDNIFYFNAMMFKLKFWKKGPKYWIFLLKWFFNFYKLPLQIITTGKPHKPED